jgi:hypothetical protein
MINPILKQAKAREPFAGNRIGRLAGPENQPDDKSAKSRCGPPFDLLRLCLDHGQTLPYRLGKGCRRVAGRVALVGTSARAALG